MKLYVRHVMIVEKIHEMISFKQSRWLEKHIGFNTQQRNWAENDFQKDFYKIHKYAIYWKTVENVRNRERLDCIRKHEYEKIIK